MSKTIKARDVPDSIADDLSRYKDEMGLNNKGLIRKLHEILEEKGEIPQ